jgi:hypothetical protein
MSADLCTVCGDPLTPTSEATCDSCGKLYHLNQRSDLPGKDCGQVWINEEHLALEFACDTCLAPPVPEGGLDDILDADEGAAVLGVGTSELVAMAEASAIRHRKTASGVYLFERRDLLALARR